ncbi:hypothetical protein VW29_15675 [Devosia limi DSM 17137]|uniref:Phage tail assembly chaperone protein, TAC n=2 Tax=Devosia limi DSM 17137 TaxID=1121477 RepID=A0A0F5LKD1_9HYPH|nr:rcc01693 family protein [Devosia limi]KKB82735.1 hypothetical protein VW29_15675 [Devosia limi DSM 17137]
MTPFPWEAAMRFGFGVLRLAPAAFWALTPRELAAAFRAVAGDRQGAPGRGELAAMMERFPDGQ